MSLQCLNARRRHRCIWRGLASSLMVLGLACSVNAENTSQPLPKASAASDGIDYKAKNQDPRARALLDEAKAKMLTVKTLVADLDIGADPTGFFQRRYEVTLERPNRFKVTSVGGMMEEERVTQVVSDGQTVTDLRNNARFIALEKPVRSETFFLGVNALVQLFFDPRGIAFDPTDGLWQRAISQFDTNHSAYDRDTKLTLMGTRTLEGVKYDVVEIRYNTDRIQIRQQVYLGADKFVYQVDTFVENAMPPLISQKFRNFRVNGAIPPTTWRKDIPDKMPTIAIDPVRMGSEAPDFTLPGASGGEFTLKELLKGKKGLFICVLDGEMGKLANNPDVHLPQMRLIQEMKNKFEKQGLAIVCIVGGTSITPDVKNEMLTNWMPDLSRFNYPIALDLDLERGLQGSAFHNFQLDRRNNLLLDAKGRVVFASNNFTNAVNNLAFYQALAQIGFSVSAADVETSAK